MVLCSYSSIVEDPQLTGEGLNVNLSLPSAGYHDIQNLRISAPSLTSNALLSSDTNHDVILRFQRRTALTLGTEHTKHVFAEVVPRLALQHKHLLHTVLATTLLHDRALSGLPQSTTLVPYHLSRAASLFNQKLSDTIAHQDRDALWATAVYLCAMAVFSVDTSDPWEAWPLKSSHPTDLEWLNMQAGLRVIWRLAQVDHGDSMFGHIEGYSKNNCVYPNLPESGIDGIPQALVELCGLTNHSTAFNSPYHATVRHLSRLIRLKGSPANVLSFMVLAGGITKEFRELLHQKDPRALLILAIWYSKLFHSTWWMARRARVECQAICLYLDGLDTNFPAFDRVLGIVRMACACWRTEAVLALFATSDDISTPRLQNRAQCSIPEAPTSKIIDFDWVF